MTEDDDGCDCPPCNVWRGINVALDDGMDAETVIEMTMDILKDAVGRHGHELAFEVKQNKVGVH